MLAAAFMAPKPPAPETDKLDDIVRILVVIAMLLGAILVLLLVSRLVF